MSEGLPSINRTFLNEVYKVNPGKKVVLVFLFSFFILFWVVNCGTAHAYLNPGTGSSFFQMVIGVLVGIPVAIKGLFRKLKALITAPSNKNKETGDE